MESNISCISGRGDPVCMADLNLLKIYLNIILHCKELIKTVFELIKI